MICGSWAVYRYHRSFLSFPTLVFRVKELRYIISAVCIYELH